MFRFNFVLFAIIIYHVSCEPCTDEYWRSCDCSNTNGISEINCRHDVFQRGLSDLQDMFDKISDNTTIKDKQFDKFFMNGNNYVKEFPSDVFFDITFAWIRIVGAYGLRKISSTAFRFSNPYLQRIEIINTPVGIPCDEFDVIDALCSMRYLQTAVLRQTNLSTIPENALRKFLASQTTLRTLEISGNKNLESLGSGPFVVRNNLTLINLSGNCLKKIDNNSFNITNALPDIAITIDMSDNQIVSIEKNAFTSSAPLFIDLSNNNLTDSRLFMNAFNDLSKVKALNISGNKLKRIESNSFNLTSNTISRNDSTISINLSRNQIELIDANSFSGNASFYIDLSRNNLTADSFSANAFTNIIKQSTIKMAANVGLHFLNQSIFEPPLMLGHVFRFERNVFKCDDCSMYWIFQKRTQYVKQIIHATCEDGFDLFDEQSIKPTECQ